MKINWLKVYLVVMFPMALALALLEPLWLEIKRIYVNSELVKNYRLSYRDFVELYRKEFGDE